MDAAEVYRDGVRERDLDNFLVEELQASTLFRAWVLERLARKFAWPVEAEIRLRKSPPRGDARQTDVELGWFDANNAQQACVLIESKVTADFQLGQAEAYAVEVDRLRDLLGSHNACSLLVAPASRLASLRHQEHFDASLAIEDIIGFMNARRVAGIADPEIDARLRARVGLLEALCGKRAASHWAPATVADKRDFAIAYADMASIIAPGLKVRPSTDGRKAITRFFDGLARTPDFPCTVRLKHEFGDGVGLKYANLQFNGAATAFEAIKAAPDLFQGEPCYLEAGSNSLFVRIDTPALTPAGDQFEAQRDKIVEGLRAIARLAVWFETHQPRLKALIGGGAAEAAIEPAAPPAIPAPSKGSQEAALEKALRSLATRSTIEFNYQPHLFVDMLDRRGGLGTARALLSGNKPSAGFFKLYERKGLSVTVEALVCQEPWRSSGLFTPSEIRVAEDRLKTFGYIPE